jgi:chaperone BCS1
MDIHVEFGRATKWQAKELFMRFFPVYEEKEDHEDEKIIANGNGHANGSAVTSFTVKGPHLTLKEVDTLATQFAGAIPEKELSMASLQGHLMQFKMAPQDAVAAAPEFVEKERERERARLAKKEKEEGKKDIPVEKPVEAAPKQENTTTAA